MISFRWGSLPCSVDSWSPNTLQDAGGPTIPLRMGRKDAPGPESQQPEGNLPGIDPHAIICGLYGLLSGSSVTFGSLQRAVLSTQRASHMCTRAVYTLRPVGHLLI